MAENVALGQRNVCVALSPNRKEEVPLGGHATNMFLLQRGGEEPGSAPSVVSHTAKCLTNVG